MIERHQRRLHGRARRITIDLDPTDDPTHGAQQLTFFNGFYDTHCYLPLLGFLRFDDEPDQFLFTAMLRPGNAPTQRGVLGCLASMDCELGNGAIEQQQTPTVCSKSNAT